MKLWKGATLALVLCGAALSVLLVKNTATIGQLRRKTRHPCASSPPSRPTPEGSSPASSGPAAPSWRTSGPHRRIRSTNEMNSLLSEFSAMFQSFTEGELRHVVETLLDRKRRKSLGDNQARRTKRARRPKLCSLRELELTVSELGLGYQSDETVLLRYCSGKCPAHRQNYDIIMEHMTRTGFKSKGRKDKVSNGPCCRPTALEKSFSFLDNASVYRTVQNVSAKHCGCV
ncbi:neurturin [Pungitius pungitius]|uniref:neurturin n=1 Tax=Pungitius pungitius TaxID=134920 RepID=UPI002E0E9E94